jgi:hypothetical protein
MAIVKTVLDGQNLTLALSAPDTFVDVLAVNIVTGDVTSSWLPTDWVAFIKQAVSLENTVVPPLDRTSLNYLARLVNLLPMDDSVFAGSSVLTSLNVYTLRVTAVSGVDPAILLVNLPHSITGAFAVADGAQGIAPPAILAGDAIGPSNANVLVAFGPGITTKGAADKSAIVTTDTKGRVFTLTEAAIQIAQSQVTDLVTDLGAKADKVVTISAGAGLTGGGDLSANRTIAMPNVGTAGTYGNATTVPRITTDAQGRVSGVVNTAITFPAPGTFPAVYGSFSDNADQPLVAGTPATVRFNTTEGANGVSVQNNGLGVPTRLTVAAAGLYEFSLSPQLLHTGGGTTTITFWAQTNTGTVPRSASSLEMGNNNNRTLPFIGLILPMAAGDWLEWVFLSTGANTSLEHFPAVVGPPAIPDIPSVIAAVKLLGT